MKLEKINWLDNIDQSIRGLQILEYALTLAIEALHRERFKNHSAMGDMMDLLEEVTETRRRNFTEQTERLFEAFLR